MKRLLITISTTLFLCGTSFAWGLREHAAVAQIAENHLTPKAKEWVSKYLGGKPMAYYASYPDYFRQKMLIDAGFEYEEGKRMTAFSHAFYTDKNLKPYRTNRDANGKLLKNTLYDMERLAKGLKENHRTMSDSMCLVHIYCIIHGMGDMHCPMHVESDIHNPTPHGKYKVIQLWKKKEQTRSLHGVWESHMITRYQPWGFTELARILDTYSEEEIAEICKGDLYTWGEDSARSAARVYSAYPAGSTVEVVSLFENFQSFAEELLSKAGYRLAKVLNDIFE